MARNNVKLLTAVQLEKLNQKYIFDADDDNIIVKIANYDRVTKHPKNEVFHINSKIRKVCFSMEAINIWLAIRNEYAYSLFDVQQAANILYVTYCPINTDSVLKLLKNPTQKIKRL